jgi:hypothetical protein
VPDSLGWSLNLQSSFGVTNEMRTGMAETVAAVAETPDEPTDGYSRGR